MRGFPREDRRQTGHQYGRVPPPASSIEGKREQVGRDMGAPLDTPNVLVLENRRPEGGLLLLYLGVREGRPLSSDRKREPNVPTRRIRTKTRGNTYSQRRAVTVPCHCIGEYLIGPQRKGQMNSLRRLAGSLTELSRLPLVLCKEG